MKLFVGLVGVVTLFLVGCTGSNANSCKDGTCSDPQRAYCDVDGMLSGTPGLCVHVECTPGAFVSCDGGKALVCNAQGNSFEANTCLNGQCDEGAGGCVACNSNDDCSGALPACDVTNHECVGCLMSSDCPGSRPVCKVAANECVVCLSNDDCGGAKPVCQLSTEQCVGCTANADCSGTKPFCDQSSLSCRACERDSECASDLCNVATGACIDASSVIYVSPQGGSGACGAMGAPCSLSAGFAKLDTTRTIIKMAMGNYSASNLTLSAGTAEVHGEGSTLTVTSGSAFKVIGTTSLRVIGLRIAHSTTDSSEFVVDVMGNGPAATFVTLSGVTLETNNYYFVRNHSLTLDRSSIKMSSMNTLGDQIYFSLQTNGLLNARRTKFDGISVQIAQSVIHVVNCLFVNNSRITTAGTTPMNDISFSTFIDSPLNMTTSTPVFMMYNNIHYGLGSLGATNVITGTAFSNHYAILSPQSSAPANSDHLLLNVNPSFVNPAAGDYGLIAGSPAIDAADPSATLTEDYDGNPRPVGAGRDLGAFEKQ